MNNKKIALLDLILQDVEIDDYAIEFEERNGDELIFEVNGYCDKNGTKVAVRYRVTLDTFSLGVPTVDCIENNDTLCRA